MKTNLLIALALTLSGCGLPLQLEEVNKNMAKMNDKINQMTDNTTNMSNSIGDMTDSLGSTSKGIHSQSLMIALNELLKPENTKYVTLTNANVIPMIAPAKAFAEIATAEEIAGIAYLWISEINLCQVDDVLTKQQKDNFDLGKWIKLNALQLIAGFIPEETIDVMIHQQIKSGGSYRTAAEQIIVLRYLFIRDFLLETTISASALTNPAQYETALSYLDSLKNIKINPALNDLNLKLFGFFDTNGNGLNQTLSVNAADDLVPYYKKLAVKFIKELDPIYINDVKFKTRLTLIKRKLDNNQK